jgi:hypothetical protein
MEQKFKNTSEWAKELASFLIQSYINEWIEKYKLQNNNLSTIFIAWAPWAWKTEFVETVLDNKNFIVIDIDKYRNYFEWYNWKNAEEYQDCSSRVATRIFDYCIKNDLKVIFDWTLTSDIWKKNIEKALHKDRKIWIVLIYQDPTISFSYTIARQIKNERKVSTEAFLRIYFNSIKYCFEMKERYWDKIHFVVWAKNKDRKRKQHIFTWNDKENFDKYFKIWYNELELKQKLEKLKISLIDYIL